MELINTVVIVMVICLIITIITQVLFYRARKLQQKNIALHWSIFLDASKNDNIPKIKEYGTKLIWNQYIKQYQIDKINEVIINHLPKYSELEKLYSISKNKYEY